MNLLVKVNLWFSELGYLFFKLEITFLSYFDGNSFVLLSILKSTDSIFFDVCNILREEKFRELENARNEEAQLLYFVKMFYIEHSQVFLEKVKKSEENFSSKEDTKPRVGVLEFFSWEELPEEDIAFEWDEVMMQEKIDKSLLRSFEISNYENKILVNDFILSGLSPWQIVDFLRKNKDNSQLYMLSEFLSFYQDEIKKEKKTT